MKAMTTVEWILPFALLIFSPIAHSQQRSPQQEEQVLKLETELVEIDVVVTDKKGKIVDGLKKEDFLLREEGKPQEISFFSFIRSGAPAATAQGSSSAALARPEAAATVRLEAGRFFFIVLDQYHIATENYPRLREALSQFLTEDLDPQDQVAVISTTGSLAVFQQASKNKKIVAAAINAFLGRGGDNKSTEAADKAFTQAQEAAGLPAAASLAFYQQDILRNTLSSLQRLAKGVSGMPGRKIAIFVSENLPVGIARGDQSLENLFYELEQVIAGSRRGGLVFYSLDPRGLFAAIPGGSASEAIGHSAIAPSSPDDPTAALDAVLDSQRGLRALAAATGGFAILDRNDLRVGLQKVLTDNQSYYLLAYYPPAASAKAKFRRIEVRIKDRPDLTVRTRQGYTSVPADEKNPVLSERERITRGLSSLVPLRNIRTAIVETTLQRAFDTGVFTAQSVIRIEPTAALFKTEGEMHRATIKVSGFAYDLSNQVVDGFEKTLNMNLRPETFERAVREGMKLRGSFQLKKPGIYNLRIVTLNNETGEIGTANDWIEIP